MHRRSIARSKFAVGLALAAAASNAAAGIDTFIVVHSSGPCGDFKFPTNTSIWSTFKSSGNRIPIATDETVYVTLYGMAANQATDATGSNIYEWVEAKGTYSGKDYVKVGVRAESQHGTGNRTVTVRWPSWMVPGQETIPFRVVATCEDLRGLGFRIAPSTTPSSPTPYVPPSRPLISCSGPDPNPSTPDPCT